jgi:hypothetical protein
MYVPSYQMHNVLNVYSKQLKQHVSSGNHNRIKRTLTNREQLTPEGKRQATIDKVSSDILNKITRFDSLAETRQRITENNAMTPQNESAADNKQETTFVFNAIDSLNQKITNTLSVEDSGFLIKKFEQLAKAPGNKKTESWV